MSSANTLSSSNATKTIKGSNEKSKEELLGLFLAISKAQAIIEFELDGTIITANENFLSTLGYTLEEIQGKHHRLFVEQEYANSNEYASFWKALRNGEYQAAEYKRLAKGGREIWIQASYNPVFDLNGQPLKVVKFATDITAQVNARDQMNHFGHSVATSVSQMVLTISEISKNVNSTAMLAKSSNSLATETGQQAEKSLKAFLKSA